MDTISALRRRKSCRGPFKETPVSPEDLAVITEAGYLAPSGCNMQTTEFIAVDDPALVKSLADIYGVDWAQSSTAAILLLTKETMTRSGVSYHVHDYCAAAENIYLAATAKGIGTVWIEGQIRGEKAASMGALLEVPKDMTVAVYMPLGYPDNDSPAPDKKPLNLRAWKNRYGLPFYCPTNN